MSRPVPDPLRRQGIRSVRDNRDGGQVRAPRGLLFSLFKDEIMAAVTRPAGKQEGRHET